MASPRHPAGVLLLPGASIDGDHSCCLGKQAVQIVSAVAEATPNVTWLAADVETNDHRPVPAGVATIGDTARMLEYVGSVVQFFSGVFVAVPEALEHPRLRECPETEDPRFVDMGDGLVEIRAFDTSYFEVAASTAELLNHLRGRFPLGRIADASG